MDIPVHVHSQHKGRRGDVVLFANAQNGGIKIPARDYGIFIAMLRQTREAKKHSEASTSAIFADEGWKQYQYQVSLGAVLHMIRSGSLNQKLVCLSLSELVRGGSRALRLREVYPNVLSGNRSHIEVSQFTRARHRIAGDSVPHRGCYAGDIMTKGMEALPS